MSEKLLEIKNLHVMYKTDEDDVYALNGINLDLDKGETLGLVGETGAGKTTIALSILKLLPERTGFITQGEILFEGQDLVHMKEEKMRMLRGNDISMILDVYKRQDPGPSPPGGRRGWRGGSARCICARR